MRIGTGHLVLPTGNHDVEFTFRPKHSNTYYFRVGESQFKKGTFKFSVAQSDTPSWKVAISDTPQRKSDNQPPPAPLVDPAGPVAVSLGAKTKGEIHTGDDTDAFLVEFEAGTAYVIEMKGAWTGGKLNDEFLWVTPFTLYDPVILGVYHADRPEVSLISGGSDHDDAGAGKDSRLTFTPTEAGTYRIEVGSNHAWTGTYEFKVSRGQ